MLFAKPLTALAPLGIALALTAVPALAATGQDAGTAQNAAPASGHESRMQAMFDQTDTNHDGKISLAEWKAAGRRERGFRMIDANHDGFITMDEMKAAMARFGY